MERAARADPNAAASRRPGPARDLSADEARGGHTLARHVGRSDQELRERLRREPRIAAASTYADRLTAEAVVAETLVREQARVEGWRRRSGARPNLALDYHGDKVIGRVLRRGARESQDARDAVVVLRWPVRDTTFYVLTSYPEIRR